MKILYITNTSKEGGSTIALSNVIHGMKELGHDIYVLTNSKKGVLYDLLSDINVKIFACNYCLTVYPLDKNPLKYLYGFFLHLLWWHKTRKYIGRLIDEYNIDATLKHATLKITIPKKVEEVNKKRIEIK